jgi:hypothetical protein
MPRHAIVVLPSTTIIVLVDQAVGDVNREQTAVDVGCGATVDKLLLHCEPQSDVGIQ